MADPQIIRRKSVRPPLTSKGIKYGSQKILIKENTVKIKINKADTEYDSIIVTSTTFIRLKTVIKI
jgi:hypothetical protein